mgnify:CR=1 FL=1
MSDADTIEAMKKNKRPVLFFHGEADTYVVPENSLYNYALCGAPKELVIIPEHGIFARHMQLRSFIDKSCLIFLKNMIIKIESPEVTGSLLSR